jgi:hypothetical protein
MLTPICHCLLPFFLNSVPIGSDFAPPCELAGEEIQMRVVRKGGQILSFFIHVNIRPSRAGL